MNTIFHFPIKVFQFISFFLYITVILPIISSFLFITGIEKIQSSWNLTAYLVIETLQIKLKQIYLKNMDENVEKENVKKEGVEEDVTQQKEQKVPTFIKNGFIITNHRSFTDLFLDVYLTQGDYVGRLLAVAIVTIWGIQSIVENRCILLQRGKDNRNTLWEKISKHKLIIYWAEGTRCSHTTLPVNYKDVELKYGLLKSIYENKKPIQIYISSGKENVVNEKRFHLGFGETVTYMIGEPFESSNYETFDAFIDKVKLEWHTLWNHVYNYNNDKNENNLEKKSKYTEIQHLTPYYA